MEHEIENLVSLLNKHIPSVSQDNSRIALQTKEACSSIKEALSTTSYVACKPCLLAIILGLKLLLGMFHSPHHFHIAK